MDEILVECDDAGGYGQCEGDAYPTFCPYNVEINEIQIPVWLCDYHYRERAADI